MYSIYFFITKCVRRLVTVFLIPFLPVSPCALAPKLSILFCQWWVFYTSKSVVVNLLTAVLSTKTNPLRFPFLWYNDIYYNDINLNYLYW